MNRYVMILVWCACVLCQTATAQTREWKLLHQGNRSFNAGDYASAEQYYREALKSDPRNTRAIFNLGDTYLAQNNPQEAMKMYADAAKSEPNKVIRAMAFHNMGYIHHKNKQYAEAIKYYKEALRNNPHDEDTRYNLALCQKQLKDNQSEQDKQSNQENPSEGNEEQQQDNPQNQPQKKQSDPQNEQNGEGMSDSNAEQLLNLSRQAEQDTRNKLNRQSLTPRKKSLRKNW